VTTVPKQFQRAELPISDLRVSRYDQASSLLISLLIMVGAGVALMFVIWLTMTMVFIPKSIPVKLVEDVAGRGDHAEGFARDLEAPGMEEMPELAEPQLETSMDAMTDAVSTVAASMDVISVPSTQTSKGEGGLGDSRPPGPLGEGDNIIPRWERWEIRFESSNIDAYARQLDFFKIELGAAGGGKKNIDYASNLSGSPQTRTGPGDAEKRLYMTWRSGSTLQQFDRQLLQRAGVNPANRLLLQFYPEEVEDRLAWIEKENAQGKTVQEYFKTVFEVRPRGTGWEFFVADQRFRPKPR